jgi:hypothetical protein
VRAQIRRPTPPPLGGMLDDEHPSKCGSARHVHTNFALHDRSTASEYAYFTIKARPFQAKMRKKDEEIGLEKIFSIFLNFFSKTYCILKRSVL